MAKKPTEQPSENNSAKTETSLTEAQIKTDAEIITKIIKNDVEAEKAAKALVEDLIPTKSSPPETKTLNVSSIADAKEKISDIEVVGNGDTWQLLCKASSKSQGWMKSCKAMEIPGYGVVVQVSTQNKDNVAEALVTIAGVKIASDVNGGKKIVAA